MRWARPPRRTPPVRPAAWRRASSSVSRLLRGGEVDGAELDNGTTLHWPPHLGQAVTAMVARGDRTGATVDNDEGPPPRRLSSNPRSLAVAWQRDDFAQHLIYFEGLAITGIGPGEQQQPADDGRKSINRLNDGVHRIGVVAAGGPSRSQSCTVERIPASGLRTSWATPASSLPSEARCSLRRSSSSNCTVCQPGAAAFGNSDQADHEHQSCRNAQERKK